MSNTLDQLCTLAQRELGAEALTDKVTTPFAELGLDSLGLVDFMFTVEDHFHVSIEHDRALQNPTLAGLATLVDELLAAKAEPLAAAA
jgi:acyl carrier protein